MRVPYPNQGVWFLPSKGKAPARVLRAIRDGRERSSVRSAAHVELGEVPGSRELDLMSTAGCLVIASNEDPMKTSGTIRSIYAGQSMRSRRGRRAAAVCTVELEGVVMVVVVVEVECCDVDVYGRGWQKQRTWDE